MRTGRCTGCCCSRSSSARLVLRRSVRLAFAVAGLVAACPPPLPPVSQVIASAIARTETLRSAHFKLDVTKGFILVGPSLEVLRAEGDVATPDRLRVRARTRLGGVIVETDIVHADGASFLLDPFTLRWQRLRESLPPLPPPPPKPGGARALAALPHP